MIDYFGGVVADGSGAPNKKAAQTAAKAAKAKYIAKMRKRMSDLREQIPNGKPGWKQKAFEHAKLGRMIKWAERKSQ